MNTLISDLSQLVDNHLDIVSLVLLDLRTECNPSNYKKDPRWLLYLLGRRNTYSIPYWRAIEYLTDNNQSSWLTHLIIHLKPKHPDPLTFELESREVYNGLLEIYSKTLKTRSDLLDIAKKFNHTDRYRSSVFASSYRHGYLDDFIQRKVRHSHMMIKGIYKYGQQNIIDYIEQYNSKLVSDFLSKKISGMLECKSRKYDRSVLVRDLKQLIKTRSYKFTTFYWKCLQYLDDHTIIDEVFGVGRYLPYDSREFAYISKGNNIELIDKVIEYNLIDQHNILSSLIPIRDDMLLSCIRNNNIHGIQTILNIQKYSKYRISFENLPTHSISIETMDIIIQYVELPSSIERVVAKCLNDYRYDLMSYFSSLLLN